MDHLRQGIHLRGYAAKKPKKEYKREAFELFSQMLVEIKHEAILIISHVQVQQEDRTEEPECQRREELARQMRFEHQDAAAAIAEEVTGITEVVNEPVAMSFALMVLVRKYKQCCGEINKSSICHK